MKENYQKRKNIRLYNHHYDTPGAYFITICTKERRNYFWNTPQNPYISDQPSVVETSASDSHTKNETTATHPQGMNLSPWGKIVDEAINNIQSIYPALEVDQYVIMPDHIHLILMICADEHGRPMVAPTMARVIQQLKGYITKRIGCSIWQKLYFDHIIRNRHDYEQHLRYIQENPARWCRDGEEPFPLPD